MSAAYSAAPAASGSELMPCTAPDTAQLVRMAGFGARDGRLAPVMLRNIGGRPLRLCAELLAEGSNRQPGATHWHEVALFRTENGQIAVALRLLRAVAGDLGVHRARLFDDLESAGEWLEQFDCSTDLQADFDVADGRLSMARLTIHAAALRERAERLERGFRGLVGEMLFRIEMESELGLA